MRYEITLEKCDRCGGSGVFYIGSHNGRLIPAEPIKQCWLKEDKS